MSSVEPNAITRFRQFLADDSMWEYVVDYFCDLPRIELVDFAMWGKDRRCELFDARNKFLLNLADKELQEAEECCNRVAVTA